MKIGKIQFFLTLLLLWTGTAVGGWADTKNPEEYFQITQDFGGPERPYLEFRYADFDFDGVDDALINPEFGIVLGDGKRIPLAKMTRCHDKMTRINEKYGLMQVLRSEKGLVPENKELRLVTMRYYPTYEAMSKGPAIYHTGLWDIDDNGKGKDIQIDIEERAFYNCKDIINNDQYTCELDYNGENHILRFHTYLPKDFKYAPDFKGKLEIYKDGRDATGALRGLLQDFIYNGLENNDTEIFEMDKKYFYHNFDLWNYYFYLTRDITVPNGSYHAQEGNKTINQTLRFVEKDCRIKMDTYRSFSLSATHNALFKPQLTIRYNDSMDDNNGIEYDIYRQGENEKERKLVATVDGDKKDIVTWVDETAEDFVAYTYWACWRQKSWPKHAFRQEMAKECQYDLIYNFETDGTHNLLRNVNDLKAMSICISHGKYVDQNWKLANDIDFGKTPIEWKSIGTSEQPFTAIFNGNGHQIKVNIKSDKELQGSLFGVVYGAVFRGLKVVGDIETSAKFAAGIAGRSYSSTFDGCEVGVNIHSTVKGDGTHGGFVGVTDDTDRSHYNYFNYCVFNGSINGENTESCGGFVGWSVGPNDICSHFENCLNLGTFGVKGRGSDVFARNQAFVSDNCYYLNDLGTNAHNAKKLTEADKNVGLLKMLSSDRFTYQPNAYPALKIFHPDYAVEGENMPDVYLNGESDFVLTEDMPYKDVRLNRTYTKGRRYTIMLPFYMSDSQATEMGTFYEYSSYNPTSGVVVMKPVETRWMTTNTPYVFEPAADFDEINFRSIKLKRTTDLPDASVTPDHNGLVGTYRPVIVPTGAYGYSAGDATNGPARGTFVKAGNGVHLPAFCAYLWLGNAPASARTLQAVFHDADGNVTGIETLERDEERPGVYTLDGRQHKTLQRGVNIVNGKKIMVK